MTDVFPSETWTNYRWAATVNLPECMEVLPEETPLTVPESLPSYQREPLLLPRIVQQIILNSVNRVEVPESLNRDLNRVR